MKRFSRLLITAFAFVLVAGGGAPATATPSAHLGAGRPVYLALGDSIAAGQQSAAPVLGPDGQLDYWATVARWKANGYVAQFAHELREDRDCRRAGGGHERRGHDACRSLRLLNLSRSAVPAMDGQPARPGVTTQRLIDEQLPAATTLLRQRNGDRNRHNDVEVVTLTVGGNDIFGPLTSACLLSDPSTGCEAAVGTAFSAFTERYATVLDQLRAAAGRHTVIITMTYYNPLPYCTLGQANPSAGAFADWVLEGGTLPQVGTLADGFNDLIRSTSQQYDAEVAETFGELGAGDFVGGADCLHPNRVGHTKLAAAFDEAFEAAR